jgi:Na+/H+ antiporter NhaC
MGIIIFFDDYFNALITGSVMRPVSDRHKIPRERLSYSLDSTAVGICLLSPVSSWSAFLVSLIAEGFTGLHIRQDPFHAFLEAIPYNFYAWLTVVMAGVTAFISLDFGPMAKAERRTRESGIPCDKTFDGENCDEKDSPDNPGNKGKVVDIIIPVSLLLIGTFAFLLYTGGFFDGPAKFQFITAMKQMNGILALIYSVSFTAVISTVYFSLRKLSSVKNSVSAFIKGISSMALVVVLLIFAWTIGGVCDRLQTGAYVASIFGNAVPGFLIPAVLFLFSSAIAVSTGASWGAYAIMMPVAISIAAALDLNIPVSIASVIGGGGFGAHCSPLADNVIISAAGADINHIDHVRSQIPYSAVCAVSAVIAYIIAGLVNNPVIPAAACALLFTAFFIVMKKLFHR